MILRTFVNFEKKYRIKIPLGPGGLGGLWTESMGGRGGGGNAGLPCAFGGKGLGGGGRAPSYIIY